MPIRNGKPRGTKVSDFDKKSPPRLFSYSQHLNLSSPSFKGAEKKQAVLLYSTPTHMRTMVKYLTRHLILS
ncbi:hypothetical protein EUGRSUZ_I01023 [Eucalyptus grandis]|uniref:Uncharacterized protein n=2 Tax=Eucalyptus grandis TaxID=71139 RepID=A0ACC3JDT8_EUCGR|nr:hypothetical protein EUGRSUZ_I01023 [Eucalyptus grandis]